MIKKLVLSFIIVGILLTGCGAKINDNNNDLNKGEQNVVMDTVNNKSNEDIAFIKLFYPDSNGMYWLVEEKEMNIKDLSSIIEYLRDGGKNSIPKDTKVLGVEVKDNVAYVNLSKEFDNADTGSSYACRLKIYSIVNTLCLNEVFNIDGVKFLIEGNEVEAIGPMIASEIIKPKVSLLPI